MTIGGIYRDYTSDRGVVAVNLELYRTLVGHDRLDGLGILAAPGTSIDALRSLLEESTATLPGVTLVDNGEIRAASLAIFDRTFTITRVLQVLVGIVAFLGILSALQALQMERRREFAVLRAVGWTPGQVRRLVLGQTGLLGLAAGILSIPLGLALAMLLIRVINLRAFGWSMEYVPDATSLLQGVALALGAAMLGGLMPALQAGRRSPSADLREE